MAPGQKRSPHVTQPPIVDIEGHTSNEAINNCKTLLHMTIILITFYYILLIFFKYYVFMVTSFMYF